MPICQNCGSEVAEGRDRCNRCGQRLGDIGIRAALSGVAKLAIVAGAGIALLVAAPVFSWAVTAAYADLFGFQSKEY
ncbi:MAG: hypothetical protein ACHQ2F_12915 [Desulfobaccales bacterium]